MVNPIGLTLYKLGLYRPIKKSLRYLTDSNLRLRKREVREDLARTRREVGSWADQGAGNADPNRLFAIVSFTNIPLHAKFHSLVAKTMQLQGYTPVIFTYSGCRFGRQYFRLFGIDRLVMWDEYVKEMCSKATVQSVTDTLLSSRPTVRQVTEIQFHGVDVGKHALSMVARRRVEGRLDLAHPQTWILFQSEFYRAVESVLAAEQFFKEQPVQKMLVRDAGYTPNGAIFETALEQGTDCVIVDQGNRRSSWVFKRYTPETKGRNYYSLSDSTWERIKNEPWTAEDDEKLEQVFAGRYKPDSTDDVRRLQSGKRLKPPDEVRAQLGLDPAKKTAVIFSQIAWDAAFFFGTCLFEDYEEWLFETVKFAAAGCPHVNWIVKLHPFNAFKLQREDTDEESEMRLLRTLMPLPGHVKILRADTDINTKSLFPIVDYVLTVNGTVGMEFPCYGAPAVLAGTGRYEGRGFTIEPPTKEMYFETLKNLHTIPRLGPETVTLARKHFYTLMTRRQTSLDDIAPMKLKCFHEARSNVYDNISITARSLDEFRASASIQRLGDWLANSNALDILEPI